MRLRDDPIGWLDRAWYRRRLHCDVVSVLALKLQELAHDTQVLDFGAGTGHIGRALQARSGGSYTFADIAIPPGAKEDESWVQLPHRGALPLSPASFDFVLMVDVLHHVPRPLEALHELHRCLKPGGLLLIVDYDRALPAPRIVDLACRILKGRWRLRTATQIAALCSQCGFDTTREPLDGLRTLTLARHVPA